MSSNLEAQKELDNHREDSDIAMAGLNDAQERADEIHADLLRELSESDLADPTKELMRNFLTKSFILANLREVEVTEFKWKLLIRREALLALHPGQDSFMQGAFRAYVYDDYSERLEALSQRQKFAMDGLFDALWFNVTRSKQFAQQEILQTSITQSIVDKGEQQHSKGGLLSRWRS